MAERLKVLVAEDDKSTQLLYEKALVAEVFDTRFSENGLEAIDLYHLWKPDILILDILMPVLTGYDVLKEIRRKLRDKETVIIMVTSAAKKEDIRDCLQFNIQGYIVKPFHFREVGTRIIQCYQEAKSRKVSDIPLS